MLEFSHSKYLGYLLMVSAIRAIVFVISSWCFLVSANDVVLTAEHFKSLGDDINRTPHPVYLQLLDIEKNKRAQLDEDTYLWFLYRKAQAEDLLYFNDEFELTVASILALVQEDSHAEIKSAAAGFEGLIAQRNGRYDQALAHFQRSIQHARRMKLSFIHVWAKREAGYTASLKENYYMSFGDLQEAYVDAYALNDHFLIALINEAYGEIYGYMDDYEKAIEYYNKALYTYERLGYQPYVADAMYGLATVYRYWKKYDLAVQKFSQYAENISYTPQKEVGFYGQYGLGMTYAEQGNCDKALPIIEHTLTLGGPIDYNSELLKRKAECLIESKQLEEAELALNQAIEIYQGFSELDGTSWQLELTKLEGQLYYAKGNITQGYTKLRDYYESYTESLIRESTYKLVKAREMMDLERLDIEVGVLKDRKKHQQLLVEHQQYQKQLQYIIVLSAIFLFVLVLVIVYQRHQNKKELFSLSITDSLTGVFNRRYIFDYLDKILSKSTGTKGELSVLLFDIDDFKVVNDKYGHQFGDKVLCRVTEICQSTLRAGDVLGRIGGEEFFCILPRTDSKLAFQVAERIKKDIQSEYFVTSQHQVVEVTASVGIAAIGELATDRASLYVQSDKALYRAKQQGKNQVVVYSL